MADDYEDIFDADAMADPMRSGAFMIVDERRRQIYGEGYTEQHDDQHTNGELGRAASAYIYANNFQLGIRLWPFERGIFRPTTTIKNLVKAGALIAAEIDRLKRAQRENLP